MLRVVFIAIGVSILLAVGIFFRPIWNTVETAMLTNEGSLAIEAHDWDRATRVYEQTLKEHPSSVPVALTLAKLYHYRQERDKAEAVFTSILKQQPENIEARNAYAGFLAQVPSRRNDAIELYRQGLKLMPAEVSFMGGLGDIYKAAAENLAETRPPIRFWLSEWAVFYYRHALAVAPELFQNRFNLGVAYQHLEKPDRAVEQYCNALMIQPKSYEAYYNLGLALIDSKAYQLGFRQMTHSVRLLMDRDEIELARRLSENTQTIRGSLYYKSEKTDENNFRMDQYPEWFQSCVSERVSTEKNSKLNGQNQ